MVWRELVGIMGVIMLGCIDFVLQKNDLLPQSSV